MVSCSVVHHWKIQCLAASGHVGTSDHATNALMCFWRMALANLEHFVVIEILFCFFGHSFLEVLSSTSQWCQGFWWNRNWGGCRGLLWHSAAAQYWHTNHQVWWRYSCSLQFMEWNDELNFFYCYRIKQICIILSCLFLLNYRFEGNFVQQFPRSKFQCTVYW